MNLFFIIILFVSSVSLFSESIPSFKEVKESFQTSEFYLLDANGDVLQILRKNPQERRLEWVDLNEISVPLLESVRVAEDKRFFEHKGVDWIAIGDGILRTFTFSSPRGASTISMQLAGLLHEKYKPRKRNLFQKWNQIQLAFELEKKWSKQEILEAYLNLVSFRGELVGIKATSFGIFQKYPHAINKKEALLLAAMLKSPSFAVERVLERACFLQKVQYQEEDCSSLKELGWKFLSKPYLIKQDENFTYHLARRILNENSNQKEVTTTLNKNLQIHTIEIAKQRLSELKAQNVKDIGVLVIENATGNVLAYIGGLFEYSKTPYVDSIFAKRQAGSTLKPFLYGLGLEKKFFTLASLLNDSSIKLNIGTGIYAPNNYGSNYYGYVTVKQALASSLNSPAIQVLELLGIERAYEKLQDLGFSNLKEAEYYGYSLALGTVDVSLWELVQAYVCLAREGECISLRYVPITVSNKNRVFSKEISFLISHTLSNREARALGFGYNNPLSTRIPAAVKTGTSKDMRDNWCVGYTPSFTIGVWVGNHSGEPMWNVSGVSGAAYIWSDILHFLYKGKQGEEFAIPEGVTQRKVYNEVLNLTYKEWFLKGTEIEKIEKSQFQKIRKIKSPIENAIYALDPDKSEASQVLLFESSYPSSENFWRLNGEVLDSSKKIYFWKMKHGFFVLELIDKQNTVIDKIQFEVR